MQFPAKPGEGILWVPAESELAQGLEDLRAEEFSAICERTQLCRRPPYLAGSR